MGWPAGVPTRRIIVGKGFSIERGEQLGLRVTITADRDILVWRATGDRVMSLPERAAAAAGDRVEIDLPCTDSDGWLDGTGHAIDVSAPGSFTHRYSAKVEAFDCRGAVIRTETITFVLPAGDEPVNLDLGTETGTVAGDVVVVPPDVFLAVAGVAEDAARAETARDEAEAIASAPDGIRDNADRAEAAQTGAEQASAAAAAAGAAAEGVLTQTEQARDEAIETVAKLQPIVSLAPFVVGEREGQFFPENCVYLADAAAEALLEGVKSDIAGALSDARLTRMTVIGHSIPAGRGVTPGATNWPRLVQQRAGQYGHAFTGLVIGVNGVADDARLTHDAEWAQANNTGPRIDNMQQHLVCRTAGKSVTYRSTEPGRTVTLYTFSNGAAVDYSIDGGAVTGTVTPDTGSASHLQATVISGLADTVHTVTVTSKTTSASFLLGMSVTASTGLEVACHAFSGSICQDWLPEHRNGAFYNAYNNVIATSPDVVLIQLGANEAIHAIGDLRTDLTALVTSLKNDGVGNIVMVADPQIVSTSFTGWMTDFYPVLYDVADEQSIPLIDLTSHWLTRAAADGAGLYADQYHPNGAGHYDLHTLISQILLNR